LRHRTGIGLAVIEAVNLRDTRISVVRYKRDGSARL
jgi:hypothetical protein